MSFSTTLTTVVGVLGLANLVLALRPARRDQTDGAGSTELMDER